MVEKISASSIANFVSEKSKVVWIGLKYIATKVANFAITYHSIIFFGFTIALSYYLTPLAARYYVNYLSDSFIKLFVKGGIFGAGLVMLKHGLTATPFTKTQDDNINYLAGIINVAQTYLSPTYGFINCITMTGFVAVKSLLRPLFPESPPMY